jgi:hypothetical protein
MRPTTSERPNSWWLPWGYLLQLQDGPDNNACLQGSASSATRQDTGQKNCPSPCPPPRPCPQCGQNGHWKDNCPSLSLEGRSVSHSHSRQSEASQTSWAWQQKTDVALGPRPPPRSTWRSPGELSKKQVGFSHLPDFSGKLFSSQISTIQKEKTVLFRIKILIKVNFKIQTTK